MPILTFELFNQKYPEIEEDNKLIEAIDASSRVSTTKKIYEHYILWLINNNQAKKVSATELLVQLKLINDFIVEKIKAKDPQNNSSRKTSSREIRVIEALVREKLNVLTMSFNSLIFRIGGGSSSFFKSLPYMIMTSQNAINACCAIGLVLGIATAITFKFVSFGLGDILNELIIAAAFTAPTIIYGLYKIGAYAVNRAAIYFQRPLNNLITSQEVSLSMTQHVFNNFNLKADSPEYEVVRPTVLTLYQGLYPKGEWSEDATVGNDLIDLEVLHSNLKAGTN